MQDDGKADGKTEGKVRAAGTKASGARRRNRAFDESHALLIETAVRLVSEKGTEALSLSAVARAAGVNRTTLYYHFDSRDALFAAIRSWSAQRLAVAFAPRASIEERTRYIARFVLENPEVAALWAQEFLAPGDIADRYPEWPGLVAGVAQELEAQGRARGVDAEAYCTLLLTWAFLGPRVYRDSVRPDLPIDEAVERLTRTQVAMLGLHGVVPGGGGEGT